MKIFKEDSYGKFVSIHQPKEYVNIVSNFSNASFIRTDLIRYNIHCSEQFRQSFHTHLNGNFKTKEEARQAIVDYLINNNVKILDNGLDIYV